MLNSDLSELAKRLNLLGEMLDRHKPLSEGAVLGWFDTLKEFETGAVFGLLGAWQKTHTKFPAPADVWKVLNEGASKRREDVAEAEKKMFADGLNRAMATPAGARSMKLIREILSRPKPSPREHWNRVMETEGLPPIAYKFAGDFLNRDKEAA